MKDRSPRLVVVAAILGAVGVMLGAYSAHGLESSLHRQGVDSSDIVKRLSQCEVAVRYQMLHTLAILAIGLTISVRGAYRWAIGFWLTGIGLFCGGLYCMVFLGKMGHWSIVPSGGLCLILGWLALIPATLKEQAKSPD